MCRISWRSKKHYAWQDCSLLTRRRAEGLPRTDRLAEAPWPFPSVPKKPKRSVKQTIEALQQHCHFAYFVKIHIRMEDLLLECTDITGTAVPSEGYTSLCSSSGQRLHRFSFTVFPLYANINPRVSGVRDPPIMAINKRSPFPHMYVLHATPTVKVGCYSKRFIVFIWSIPKGCEKFMTWISSSLCYFYRHCTEGSGRSLEILSISGSSTISGWFMRVLTYLTVIISLCSCMS